MNEEMIDGHYTKAGKLLMEAAARLDRLTKAAEAVVRGYEKGRTQ